MSVKIKKHKNRTVIDIHRDIIRDIERFNNPPGLIRRALASRASDKVMVYTPFAVAAGFALLEPSSRQFSIPLMLIFGYFGRRNDQIMTGSAKRVVLEDGVITVETGSNPSRREPQFFLAGMTDVELVDPEVYRGFYEHTIQLSDGRQKAWIAFDASPQEAKDAFELIKSHIDNQRGNTPRPRTSRTPPYPGQPGN